MSTERDAFQDELAALRREIALLNSHRFIIVHNSVPRLIAFQLLRGIAFGLGGVLGATVVLSVVVWSLSQIDFIPIIGDWSRELIIMIQPELEAIVPDEDGDTGAAPEAAPRPSDP